MQKLKHFFIYFLLFLFGLTFVRSLITYPIISIACLSFIIWFGYKFEIPKFGIFIFLMALILRIAVVILFDTPIISDYSVMFNIAKEIVSGNLTAAANSEYMLRWGYQMGYTLFMSLLLFICNNVLFIKIVNCIFTSLIVLLIYLITKEITNKKVARIISLIYMVFPFPLLFNTVLSNQHISSFFFLLAIYIFISKKFKQININLRYLLIGVCLAVGNIIRPEAIIFIMSILLFLILTTKKEDVVKMGKNFGILILVYLIITTTSSFIVTKTGISPSGFKNTEPLWKFTVGLNPETKGDYNAQLSEKFNEESNEEHLKRLYNYTIGSLDKLPSLFMYKAQHFWIESDLGWSLFYLSGKSINVLNQKIKSDSLIALFYSFNQLIIYIIFIFAIIAIILKRKNMSRTQLFFLIILLVYFGVYLLIESTPRYAYTAQIFLFLMSMYTVEYLLNCYQKKKVKKS